MTMRRYAALTTYWNEIPPADIAVAAYFGIGMFAKKDQRRARQPFGNDNRGLPQQKRFDHRGFPLRPDGSPLPPTLDEKPGTLKDLAMMLKRTGRKAISF